MKLMLRGKIKAFTLVEMLIVVIIIGILAAALLPKLKGAQQRARDTARKANLSQVSTALEMYFNDKGRYPNGSCLNDIEKELVPTYIGNLPRDPQKGRVVYGTRDNGCDPGEY
jgi:general secretion pathway protein G